MTIADRILELRKIKGISQEELADKIGVSRQAVSKWESEQSIPDLDKIIILSEFFEVSTDFLLKGIEADKANNKEKEVPYFLNTVATAFNFLGLVMSTFIWNATQEVGGIIAGIVFIVLGCMIFAVGIYQIPKKDRTLIKSKFWKVNIWLIAFIPLSLIYNIVFSRIIAPYPLVYSNTYYKFVLFWIVYIVICSIITYLQIRKEKKTSSAL